MKTVSVAEAAQDLDRLIAEAADAGEPIRITGRRGTAVLVSESVWRGMQETLYLLSIPGMRESIREASRQPLEGCTEAE